MQKKTWPTKRTTPNHHLTRQGGRTLDRSNLFRRRLMPTKSHTLSDDDREKAFHRIKAAAKKFGVDMHETNWKQLGNHPHTH
jgi:hypothetical protein